MIYLKVKRALISDVLGFVKPKPWGSSELGSIFSLFPNMVQRGKLMILVLDHLCVESKFLHYVEKCK